MERNTYWVFKPLLLLCKVLFITPFPTQTATVVNKNKKIAKFFVNLFMCIFIYAFLMFVLAMYANGRDKGFCNSWKQLSTWLWCLWYPAMQLTSISQIPPFVFRNDEINRVLRQFDTVKEMVYFPIRYELCRKKLVREMTFFGSLITLYMIGLFIRPMQNASVYKSSTFPIFVVLKVILFGYTQTSLTFILLFMRHLMLYMKESVHGLNAAIRCYSIEYEVQTKANYCMHEVQESDWNPGVKLLKPLRGAHLCLFNLNGRLNSVVGLNIFLYVLYIGLSLTSLLFDAAISVAWSSFTAATSIIPFIVKMYVNCFLLYIIIDSCGKTVAEADSTGVLVSEMLLKVRNSQARRELRLFSHQLLHTKFRFSACGFFSLDFRLLTSMTAAVVTHLVILVQFQLAEKDSSMTCDCPVIPQTTEVSTFGPTK